MSGRDGGSVGVGERRAERVARLYGSAAYGAIVRIRERLALFEQVCRVLVEHGQLRMAWVGEVDDHGWIVPVAHAGVTDGFFDDLQISVLDAAMGRGPTGIAARERVHVFVGDIATDARMGPWREGALARGYRSSAAFALVVDDRCVAVLTAYACEAGFFAEDAVELFERMAADLSFALEAMRREERREALEAELRSNEERFRVAAESMLDGFVILSPIRDDAGEISDFGYRYVNDAYCAFVGVDRGRLLGHRVGEVFPHFLDGERFGLYRHVALTGEPSRTDDVQLPATWDSTALASRVFDTVIASMGEDLVVSVRDITERKRAEAELANVRNLLERTQQISKTGGWECDIATGKLSWTDEVYRIYGLERTSDPTEVPSAIAAYDQESAPIITAAFERLVAEGEPYDLELGLVRADGQRIWVRTIGQPIMDEGRVVRVGGHIADITERKEAEQELQLRAELLDLAHDAVIVREPVESRVTFWNRAAEVIYGYRRDEAMGQVTHELLATVFPESAEAFDEALAQQGRWEGELRHTRKDGEAIVVSSRQALARGEHGQPLAIIALNSDITERKEAEQELQLRAELLDLAHDAVIVREPAENRVTFWNREAEMIYGFSRDEAMGQVTHDLLAAVFPVSHAAVGEALARDGQWEGELRHRCKDGTVIVISSRQSLQRGADGEPVAIIELNSDITERKQAEGERERALAELQEAEQIAQLGSWHSDPATGTQTWSVAMYDVYGRDPADGPIRDEELASWVHPDDLERVRGSYARMLQGGEGFECDHRLLTAHRGVRRVHAIARPDPDQPGSYRGTVQDVTVVREAEEKVRALNAELEQRVAERTAELERANRELEAFAYSVSHDLRAPLRAMDGFSRILSTEYADVLDERGQHYLARVRAGAQRMGTMIDDLLQLSRVSRADLHRDWIDLSDLARQIAAELRAAEPDRRVEFAITDGLTATGDRELVRIALENLLGNAWKFTSTRERALIEFTAREFGDRQEFVVRDNGVGFDMEHAGQLFRPFQRLHGVNEFAGTGIGLASVDRIITRHGGRISAQGEVGRGATFAFTLETNGR